MENKWIQCKKCKKKIKGEQPKMNNTFHLIAIWFLIIAWSPIGFIILLTEINIFTIIICIIFNLYSLILFNITIGNLLKYKKGDNQK